LNNGTISVTGANSLYTGRILAAGSGTAVKVGNGGLIHVADVPLSGTLTLTAGSVNARANFSLYGGGEVIGAGVVTATTVANAGLIVASGGTLAIDGSITGTGSEAMYAGATLELNGAVAASQAIAFNGANTVLKLAQAASFKGYVTKFAAGDEIDLTGVAFKTGATATLSGNTLTLHDGTLSYAFRFGPSDAAKYTVSSDGHGGTDISAATSPNRALAFTHEMASFGRGASGPDLVPAFAGEGAIPFGDARIATPAATLRHAV
jgi:hypothetical protein